MSSMPEERTFQIQLEGLIQLLAQNLYADPDVFLREMIQNAHDSIVCRAEQAGERGEQAPPARIQVVADAGRREIRIRDNGSGLTDAEIDGYLSTIGRSGTGELRQQVAQADRGRAVELIGQFGIGLLSAFIVADRVTVLTRSAGPEALRWESDGGRNYTVAPAQRSETGTTVILHVTPEHSHYLDRSRLESIIRTYADFIGMPVYVNDDASPANAVTAPWHRGYDSGQDRAAAYHDFWEHRFSGERSLHVFAVDETFEWPDAARPGGRGTGRVRGVAAAQEALGTRIVAELTELSRASHSRFLEIMRWHAYHILAMSVQAEHEDFFRAVADLMPLESDQGPVTIPGYLATAPQRADGTRLVYYIIERGSANQGRHWLRWRAWRRWNQGSGASS
ncbi:MAG TPA: ATP-binding protein [Streptosporangiaceae bacterium]